MKRRSFFSGMFGGAGMFGGLALQGKAGQGVATKPTPGLVKPGFIQMQGADGNWYKFYIGADGRPHFDLCPRPSPTPALPLTPIDFK